MRSDLRFGEYFPNPGLKDGGFYTDDDVSTVHALFTEAWGTFILAFVVFSLTHAKKSGLGDYLGALAPVPKFFLIFLLTFG